MKFYKLILIMLIVNVMAMQAQTTCGIYRTSSDFKSNRITSFIDSVNSVTNVQFSDALFRPYVYIKNANKKIKMHIDSVYGYKNNEGDVFRIWKQHAYLIEDTGVLYIYSTTYKKKEQIKYSSFSRLRTVQKTDYFFSTNADNSIILLTINNIALNLLDEKFRQCFPDNQSLEKKEHNRFAINNFMELDK